MRFSWWETEHFFCRFFMMFSSNRGFHENFLFHSMNQRLNMYWITHLYLKKCFQNYFMLTLVQIFISWRKSDIPFRWLILCQRIIKKTLCLISSHNAFYCIVSLCFIWYLKGVKLRISVIKQRIWCLHVVLNMTL